jgi:NitT/TauT family transport system ATP-binding protein
MLEIKNALIGYDDEALMRIEHLSIQPGEVTALIGKSGCGKSTLCSTIAGHIPLIKGGIELNNHDEPSYMKKNISLTLQGFPLFHWLSVEENLILAANIKGSTNTNFDDILEQFSAKHIAKAYPSQLSGGEKCRASLAQAILTEPSLLMLDEPFVGLDTITKDSIGKNIFSFVKKNNISVLMITHEIHDAIEYAQKVVVLGREENTNLTIVKKIYKSDEKDVYQKIMQTLKKEY